MISIRLGDYIEPVVVKNNGLLSGDSVRGISTQKKFAKTKADVGNVSLEKFNIVFPHCFAFNPNTARMGDKICIALNNTDETFLVSAIYPVFKIRDESVLNPRYLMMFFNRSEFDRYVRFHSWGSARETFSYQDFEDIELRLPTKDIQDRFVDIYESLLSNLRCFEDGLDDLKMFCDLYIEELRRNEPLKRIGDYIEQFDVRNKDNACKNVKSVSTTKYFNDVGAKVNKNDLKNYKLVPPNYISYVQTTGNEKCLAFAINDTDQDIVVTSVNIVFKTNDFLDPYYLGLFFRRKEFDRYARFISWGSARETVAWQDLEEVRIPIPDISIQKRIADCFKSLAKRREYVEKLKQEIMDICPILIRGSIKEAQKGAKH